ncbi:DUF637 domain-containing protein [Vibrio spartinae]|uniref:Adenosine monophosphate-protein transferase and cysteine protease IbpA n=1 Tax=Vibrio spartinae TaxID=1918945 RepID=A0A1N6LZM4_9VIBR|nr:DUF637 domain-containing protein [Vibrio spartinae]SIO92566.1 Adenosine monophosphate-protein transferase and cysteine protease IbpA precursor [Vibrio spartinae]
MMKNKKIPLWQRLTSSILLPVLLTHMAFPVYAAAVQHVALESITNAVASSARYRLQEQVRDYLYAGAIEKDELAIFDGFEFFFTQIKAKYPEMLSAYQGANTTLDDIPTRFGTPYVERGIIREQLVQLLNKNWISAPGYSSYNEQTKKLYENAVRYAKSAGKKLGEPLTEEQISQLSTDMVWPETRVVNGHEYLIPFVYLVPTTIEQQRLTESTLTAGSADIHTNSFVVNGAHVDIKHKALLDITHDFINTKGTISGGQLTIRTGRDLQNLSGTITGDNVSLIANRLVNDTLVTRLDYGHGYAESFDQIGSIVSLGDLNIQTTSDVVSHGGQFSAQGDLQIRSEGNIILVPQVTKSARKESGQHWSESESSLVNLQTHLSAIDTLSLISGGEVYIEGAALESQGLLEILAAHGITLKSAADMHTFDSRFHAESGGMFGTKESESESRNEAEIVRTLLKAGQSLVLRTLQGNILLEAVTVDSRGISKIIAEHGEIDFELAKLLETYSYQKSYDGALSFRHQGHGYQREVAYYSEFINSGGIMLDAYNGVRIQYAGDKYNLDSTLATLAQSPELAWMEDIRNDPSLNVDWQDVQLVMEEWDYDQSGLTPAAMTILAIAMAIATGPGGLTAFSGQGAMIAAVNTGVSTLVMQASASLLANGFDIKDTLKSMASDESLKSLATSMVTAGVLGKLNVGGLSNGIQSQVTQMLMRSAVSSGIATVINGGSVNDFSDSFKTSFSTAVVTAIGAELAEKIGDAAGAHGATESNPTGTAQIDVATKYIAHAALGCGLGGAMTSISGGNHSDYQSGCISGAAGGVIGEYVAGQYLDEIASKQLKVERAAADILSDNQLTETQLKQHIAEMRAQGVDISRMAAALTVFAFHGNVDIADYTAGNAAQHNVLFLLVFAFNVGMAVWTAYDIYNTIDSFVKALESGKPLDELVQGAILELAINLTVGKFGKAGRAILKSKPADELFDIIRKELEHIAPSLTKKFDEFVKNFQLSKSGKPLTAGPGKEPVDIDDYVSVPSKHPIPNVGKLWPDKTTQHVIKGDFDELNRLVGGMHTAEGLADFIKLRELSGTKYTLKEVDAFLSRNDTSEIWVQTLPNGVKRLQLPREGLHRNAFERGSVKIGDIRVKGIKTIFPENFTHQDIVAASQKVLQDNYDKVTKEELYGVYKGISIRLSRDLNTGRIKTIHPSWNQ